MLEGLSLRGILTSPSMPKTPNVVSTFPARRDLRENYTSLCPALRQFGRVRIQSVADRSDGTRKMWVFIELANVVPSANTNQVRPVCKPTDTREPSAHLSTLHSAGSRATRTATHDRSKIPPAGQ